MKSSFIALLFCLIPVISSAELPEDLDCTADNLKKYAYVLINTVESQADGAIENIYVQAKINANIHNTLNKCSATLIHTEWSGQIYILRFETADGVEHIFVLRYSDVN